MSFDIELEQKTRDILRIWNSDCIAAGTNWATESSLETLDDFFSEWGDESDDFNVPINVAMTASPEADRIGMAITVLHPRKSAEKLVFIKTVTDDDLPKLKEYLDTGRGRHDAHFDWATRGAALLLPAPV